MCGIIGYTGYKEAQPLLLEGLKRLEYRGYDSWGIALHNGSGLHIIKKIGRVGEVNGLLEIKGSVGIGHTRWATTGSVQDRNAHPFTDQANEFAVVHNGIIENYLELKEGLRKEGVQFSSDTDSEMIVHLVAKSYHGNLKEAVLQAIPLLQGAYAFCVMKKGSPELIGARNGSPLIIGLGKSEHFFASDISAIIEHTRQIIYLEDFQVAEITTSGVGVFTFQGEALPLNIKEVNWNLEQAQKQGYKHFMLKEIFEQPRVVRECMQVPLDTDLSSSCHNIVIVACGTAYYAGLVGKYLIESLAKIPVSVEIASEFRYKEPVFTSRDVVLAISQSGETADTLAAVRLARSKGARTLGIINVMDSTIAREVDTVIYTRAGPEIGVASTKAFMAQLIMLYKIAFSLCGKVWDPDQLHDALLKALELNEHIRHLAQNYHRYHNFFYIGRNRNYPLALEGALKLKEISYIHAEAYPAGELKHGPISLVSEDLPTVAICPQDSVYEKTLSNIEEIKARQGKVIALATEGDRKIAALCDEVIYLPRVEDVWYPCVAAIPLQLFAYHIADIRGCDVDKPRNLAKSVTVE